MKQVINIIGISFLGFVLAYFSIMSTSFLFFCFLENNFDLIMFYYWAITLILGFIFAFWIKKLSSLYN